MKIIRMLLALAMLASMTSACAGYAKFSGPGWLHPDDARGHVQADSECDFGRGANDHGSRCFVSRRPAPSEDH
jgi:hypothetical protein